MLLGDGKFETTRSRSAFSGYSGINLISCYFCLSLLVVIVMEAEVVRCMRFSQRVGNKVYTPCFSQVE